MTKKLLAVGLLLSTLALTLSVGGRLLGAKDVTPEDLPKARCNDMMAKVKAGDLPGFFEVFQTYSTTPKQSPPEVMKAALKSQRDEFAKQFGKPLGETEWVRTEAVGKSFVRLTYLDKFERYAMMWQFVFYRCGDEWQLQSLNWTGNAATLFGDVR